MHKNGEMFTCNKHFMRTVCGQCAQKVEMMFPDVVESDDEGDDCYDSEEVQNDADQDQYDDEDDLDYDPSIDAY